MFIEIGCYLNQRLAELGVQHLFGVPGDFNLSYLEQVEADAKLAFIGNCNELNAAYAADGYARINGFGALLTTYGVGDLSAINGVAGAYAEKVPVVVISGIPPLHAVEQGALLHHTLVDGNYQNILNCMKEFSVAQTRITPANAAAEIDRVLRQCWIERRPVYIQLPSDITHVKIDVDGRTLDLSKPKSDPEVLAHVVQLLSEQISQAKNPALLIDHDAHTFQVTTLLGQLAEKCGIPYACLNTTKNTMDESSPLYAGVYVGAVGPAATRKLIEQSDCLIGIGVRFSDVGSAYFTHRINTDHYIEIKQYDVTIDQENYPGIEIQELLSNLLDQVVVRKVSKPTLAAPLAESTPVPAEEELKRPLTHLQLWQEVGQFLRDDDVIIGEVGTSNSALSSMRLPKQARYISQPLWGSIGYTLPALLGSMVAAPKRRHVLFIGDGSIQLTMQELSTIIREDLKPIIFILNNGGYTIERLILGENAKYNDVQNWKYTEMVKVFNGQGQYDTFMVENLAELKDTLAQLSEYPNLAVVELKLAAMDAPSNLTKFADLVARYDYGDMTYQKLKHPQQDTEYKKAIAF